MQQKEYEMCNCDLKISIPNTEIDPNSTLLKYSEPYKVNPLLRKADIKPKAPIANARPETKLMTDNSPETQEVLDCIQDPRFWMENGELWTQAVSPATTMRHEIQELNEAFNTLLWESHARPRGVCPVRYDIICQLFDELIRQVTVTSAERGLCLVRIRSELKYTIQTYHTMWRDVMEYFEPIVEKSVGILSTIEKEEAALNAEIKNLRQSMEDLHWKMTLLEQERAYERQATLDWFKKKKRVEKMLMDRLVLLVGIMTSEEAEIPPSEVVSKGMKAKKAPQKKQEADEFGNYEALKLSDILKDLIVERKEAEEKMNTKELLNEEIVWVKGEISKTEAFLHDIINSKKPLSFNRWLSAFVTGYDQVVEAIVDDFSAKREGDGDTTDKDQMDRKMIQHKDQNVPIIQWMARQAECTCAKDQKCCQLHKCTQAYAEFLFLHTITEYLSKYDDRPRKGRFEDFYKKYLRTIFVKDVPGLAHVEPEEIKPTVLNDFGLASTDLTYGSCFTSPLKLTVSSLRKSLAKSETGVSSGSSQSSNET